jgi:hypothetical protein
VPTLRTRHRLFAAVTATTPAPATAQEIPPMWDVLIDWFGSRQWEPHGHCFLWTPALLWTIVLSNLLIGLAYYSIPLTLLTLVRKRQDLVHRGVFVLFAIFIFG